MRVSEHFGLNRSQAFLDFVDVPLNTDLPVFVDPIALRAYESPWSHECVSLLQNYFQTVLSKIRSGSQSDAIALLSCLNERNEFHLGYSRGASRGHAFGALSAESVWGALAKTKAAVSGLLEDLEDTCLLIEGIGRDMISDAVCNIIRGPLVSYTQDMCEYYGIPLTENVDSGPIWNSHSAAWESRLVSLPLAGGGRLVLVPKLIVRHRISCQHDEFYTHFLLPEMQNEELMANTGLVQVLKTGTRRVTKKALRQKYGSTKASVVEQTILRPNILQRYKSRVEKHPTPALSHGSLAKMTGAEVPDLERLLTELEQLPVGKEHATAYEDLIERLLSALFYGNLCHPTKQHQINQGRKRIDITYTNEAQTGFFRWLAAHYPSAFIFVECKNYGKEIGNPELDQLSGRFSPSRGKVGLLVCRNVADEDRLAARCADTARDERGFVVTLTDADIVRLVSSMKSDPAGYREYSLLRERFLRLVAS